MQATTEFLTRHGHAVLFLWVLAEQLGLPIPAIPILLAAGALAQGETGIARALATALVAALLGDLVWYEIGRRRGGRVLNLLCRITLEPDSCVRRTEEVFARHGARSLLVAKFVPGLGTAAPPLAGVFRMRLSRFLLFDTIGGVIWAGAFLVLGALLSEQLEGVARATAQVGSWVGWIVGGLALYLVAKYVNRRRFLHRIRVARINPEELKRRIDAGEPIVIVDLRSSLDFEAEPETIPGALRIDQDELVEHHHRIPRDREIVLYCT